MEWGGGTAPAHYPPRLLHGFAFRWELPQMPKHRGDARLRFVEPVSIHFDAFPDYVRYEIIPMVWDCWPKYFEMMVAWLKRHHVRTAIFTSRQTAELLAGEIHSSFGISCYRKDCMGPSSIGSAQSEG